MRRVALIANPDSGSADELDVAALLAERGAEVQRFEIADASAAADADCELIVVAGGDGSIAPAAAAAAASARPLAVVPTGTANDFAGRMGLPADPEEAVRVALESSESRELDLARAGRRPFLNVASLGLAPAAADAADELKPKLGALAYTVGALSAATQEEPLACRVLCDSKVLFEGEAWQVTVGSTGAFGGGSQIDADADDGSLDVVVIEGCPRPALARRALGLRRGEVENQEGVLSGRCAEITVEHAGKELNIDGELVPAGEVGGGEIVFSVARHAIRIVIGRGT